MSEPEKKGSTWPWIVVPAAAVIIFFVLRECQHRIPPAEHAATPEAAPAPEADAKPAPAPAAQ